ncbi:MAG: glycine cleavage system aminomethyltransferase GcvT [Phycisphaerales bacterium]
MHGDPGWRSTGGAAGTVAARRPAGYPRGMTDTAQLLRTPFHAYHLEKGGKMVPFAGWEMPLHYGSILDEHHQVRTSGGIFDVSHMGRFMISGRDAQPFLDRICTRQVYGMKDGQARYSIVCNESGGCHDDVLVYKIEDGSYMMVCNASNREKLVGHIDAVKAAGDFVFKFEDFTTKSAMIALQGPKVIEAISAFTSSVTDMKRYHFVRKSLLGLEMFISRTGYTGEDGVEVIFRTDSIAAKAAMKLFLGKLDDIDVIKPAGLGARDSLRLEAAMALYGNEITEELDPVSAGIMFAIRINKGEKNPEAGRFIGQDALQKIHTDGPKRSLVGLTLDGRRAARQDMHVFAPGGEAAIGTVTSGCFSPTLERSIAMAYVDADLKAAGTAVEVDLGRTRIAATVTDLPFYKPG